MVGGVGVPKGSWVSTVEASRFDEATAYVTFDRHTFGDMKPYLYKTADYGKTWKALPVQDSGVRGYAHVIKEDTVKPNVLFIGTEFGLWISIDGGERWAQYKGSNFPSVAVRDIVVHPRASDLVLATHGRGIWIIDDISPLRSLTPELMSQTATFIPSRPAVEYIEANGGWPEGDETFVGPSRPNEALITYYQKARHIYGDLKIEVFDQQGKLLDTLSGSKHRGINRAMWPMRLSPPIVPPAASAAFGAAEGPKVVPAPYTVKMTKGDQSYTTQLNVVSDPRAKYTVEDRKAQFDLAMKLYGMLSHMSWVVDAIVEVRDEANQRAAKIPTSDALHSKLNSLAASSDQLRAKIVATKEGGAITGEERLREYVTNVYGDVNSYDGRPTDAQIARTDALGRELEDVIKEFQKLTADQLPGINAALGKQKLSPIQVIPEAEWQTKHAPGGQTQAAGKPTWERD